MKVLFLGNIGSPIVDLIKSSGDEVVITSRPLNLTFLNEHDPEFIVSSGYPHRVSKETIEFVQGKIINLHISYLPWNRGADPDFWSLIDNTPKGVTIHYMDETFDTGDIIIQSEVRVEDSDTLATYHERLRAKVVLLFEENWSAIRLGTCERSAQGNGGTYHRSVDKNQYIHLLSNGSQTRVVDILNH